MRPNQIAKWAVLPGAAAAAIGLGAALEIGNSNTQGDDARIISTCTSNQTPEAAISQITQQCLGEEGASIGLVGRLNDQFKVGASIGALQQYGKEAQTRANRFDFGDFGKNAGSIALLGLVTYGLSRVPESYVINTIGTNGTQEQA